MSPDTTAVSRRQFMQQTAVAGAVGIAAPYFVPSHALASPTRTGANDKLQIGLIGAGGMGRGNLDACAAHEDVVVTAVCDVWKERRDAVCAQYPTAKPYGDYRQLLQQADVDAVIIATPPHWHCLIAVACLPGGQGHLPAEADVAARGRDLRDQAGRGATRADQPGRHADPRR